MAETFLQVDPFVGTGWNAYGYVDHNPVAESDRRGLAADSESGPQPNMCSRDQIDGGYEEVDGECVLTGWNWGYVGGGGGRWIDGCITRACEPGEGDWIIPPGGWPPPPPPDEPPLPPSCDGEYEAMKEACEYLEDPGPSARIVSSRGPSRPSLGSAPALKASAGKADTLRPDFAAAIGTTKPTSPLPGGGHGGGVPTSSALECVAATRAYVECLAKLL